ASRPGPGPRHDGHGRAGAALRGAGHLLPRAGPQPRAWGRRGRRAERGAVPGEGAGPHHHRRSVVSAPAAAAPVVYKFGGTSVAGADRIRHVARLVEDGPRPLVVVVSAMAGVTDTLQRLAAMDGPAPADVELVTSELLQRHLAVLDDLAEARAAGAGDLGSTGARRAPDAASDARARIEERIDALRSAALGRGALTRRMRDDEVLSAGEDLSQQLVVAALRGRGVEAEAADARDLVVTDARF